MRPLKHRHVNHLGSHIERMAHAKFNLPKQLLENYQKRQTQTQLVQSALQGWLDDGILMQCQVTQSSPFALTLTVGSYTAATYLRHLSDSIITELKAYDDTFAQLHTLHIHVYMSK